MGPRRPGRGRRSGRPSAARPRGSGRRRTRARGLRDGAGTFGLAGAERYRARIDQADPGAARSLCPAGRSPGGRPRRPRVDRRVSSCSAASAARGLLRRSRSGCGTAPARRRRSRVPAVAIVGARAATTYGCDVAASIAYELAERGVVVVSGAAYGIDGAAHRAALAAGGTTVAVLACGVDRAYPVGHEALIERIAAQGAVVSEAPPGRHPSPIEVPHPQPDHRGDERRRRGGRGRASQRRTQHRALGRPSCPGT